MILYPFLIIFYLLINPTSANETSSLTFIHVDGAWVRATKVANSAAYMKIVNNGSKSDRLISVQTEVCNTVELHTHLKEGDVYKMRPIDFIDIPAGQTVDLKEGGLHIMLLNIFKPLKEKEKIKLTLTFEKTGQVSIIAEVRKNRHECNCKG
ncbi:hypothetical protein IM40_00755 [Candidatus Paracaedimonas acanthamoebae]|nr:hypothetical protein IM40_00755 [Candidatus Paracaedimonas acanthamoebae]